MLARSWFDALKSHFTRPLNRRERRAAGNRVPAVRRLRLESLEDRCLLAFLAPVDYNVGSTPVAIVSADFNNDSALDLAIANANSSTVSVLLGKVDGMGQADGTFQPAVPYATTGAYPVSLAVGDLDGDGKIDDLATANSGYGYDYDVSVLLGNDDGTFQPASSVGIGSRPASVAVGDFNGDGLMDLGVASNVYTPGFYYYDDSCGCYYWSPGYDTGYANVLLGTGGGGFSAPNSTFVDYAYHNSALATDLNGDIYDDLVTFDSYGYVTPLLGDGSGFLQGPTGYFYTGDYSYAVAAGYLDGDSNIDLVTANYYGNSVGVLLGDGAGNFSGPTNYDVGGYPTAIVLGDFTGDGNLDVATSNYNSDQVSVLYGDGTGAFSTPSFSATGSYPWAIAAGDFNGDTWLDAATVNQGSDSVSVLINDQNWPDPPPPLVSINDPTAVLEGNTGSVNVTFTVTLSAAYSQDVTVHFETANGSAEAGSDYTGASGDVTVARGSTTQTFTVAVLGDRSAESTENFVVNLSAPVNATIRDGQGIGTILDDEPRISINDKSVSEGNTGSVNATFTVTLSAMYDADVTVHYDTANGTATAGSDYTGASGDVTVPRGSTTQTFTVAITGDRVAEPTEKYFVNLSAPTNAGISDGQGVGTILDNEPRIGINNVSKKEGQGNTTQFVFTVTLSAAYDQAVTVTYATANGSATAGSDYQSKSGTLTFAPGVTSMTFTIIVIADKSKEASETFYVNLSGASGNSLIDDAQGIGTILNDDKR